MEKRVRSKEELLEQKDEILKAYNSVAPKNRRSQYLSKKEKKALGIGRDMGSATLRHARIPSSKVRIVNDLIKGKPLDEAYAILKHTPRKGSRLLYKLVQSAEANAVNNYDLDRDALYVADAYANQGATLKRLMPRARGSANRIRKRTSHITVVLKERDDYEEVE